MFTLSRKFTKLKVALAANEDAEVKSKQSKWSKNFSLGNPGIRGVLSIKGQGQDRKCYDLGVEIERSTGMFNLTNIITFYPRYKLQNCSRDVLRYK